MNVSEMNTEELLVAKAEIEKRIEEINGKKKKLCLYTHRCKDSANHHMGKYKHWAKLVSGIDTSKTNGYAFIGEFLGVNYEHMVPEGSIVVEVCDCTIIAWKIGVDKDEKLGSAYTNSAAELINKLSQLFV